MQIQRSFVVVAWALWLGCSRPPIPARDAGNDAGVAPADAPRPPADCAPTPVDGGEAAALCASLTDCYACVVRAPCGWCPATNRCAMAYDPKSGDPVGCCASGWSFNRAYCPGPDGGTNAEYCAQFTDCESCARHGVPRGEGCGWCSNNRCLFGDDTHAVGGTCIQNWHWLSCP